GNAPLANVNWGPNPANAGTALTVGYQNMNLVSSTTTTTIFFIGFLRKDDNQFFDHYSFQIDSDQNSAILANFAITTLFSETFYEILFGLLDNRDFVE
ncbi:15486_t:CDS:1, partial [Gigaspora margarita]